MERGGGEGGREGGREGAYGFIIDDADDYFVADKLGWPVECNRPDVAFAFHSRAHKKVRVVAHREKESGGLIERWTVRRVIRLV